ncbi:MAG: helical backbone metal receptor [Kofleriaceae bacterium]
MSGAVLLLLAIFACRRPAETPGELRLVSLTPSATEVLAALELTARVVGVDDFSAYPPEVRALPKVGSFLSPNLEAILALRPSYVIADDVHTDTAAALRDAGVATVIFPMHSLRDVEGALTKLGEVLHRGPQAKARLAAIEQAVASARAAKVTPPLDVLVIIDREAGGLGNLVGAADGSWSDQLLAILGANNVLAGVGVRYPKVSVEEVLKADPDVILDLSFTQDGGEPWKGVDVAATRTGRVASRTDAYLISPSPRVAEALAALREVLRGPG